MRQVRAGDARRLALLFERHHLPLYRYYVRMTGDPPGSEDLVQEVFCRMLKYKATYHDGADFTTWMYGIARNARHDQWRKLRREAPLDPDWDPSARADETLERRQEIALLRRALLELPEEKREVLVLSRYQGLKYEQMADLLGCEAGAVKVRVYRALRSLREIYFELAGVKVL